MEYPHDRAVVYSISVAGHLRGRQDAEIRYLVGFVEGLKPELSLEPVDHFVYLASDVILVIWQLTKQAISPVVDCCPVLGTHRLNDGQRLF